MPSSAQPERPAIAADERIIFQGDSITDCGRAKQHDGQPCNDDMGRHLGSGYAALIGGRLSYDSAEGSISLQNFGISGNRIVDLAARAQEHIWNHRPTLLSILIGVNDTWHGFMRQAGVDIVRFARTYRQLLADTRERLPTIRFVLCEPFVLPCGVVAAGWREDIDQRRAAVARLAQEFEATLVPLQHLFDAACQRAPASHWAADGVHPTAAGHHLIATAWLKAIGYDV